MFVALCDQPAVAPAVIRRLIDERVGMGARLVVPEWRGRGGHPVLLSLTLRASLLNLDSTGGLRALFEAHAGEVLRVPVASAYIARDMDTWEDYCALYGEVFGVPPPVAPPARQEN